MHPRRAFGLVLLLPLLGINRAQPLEQDGTITPFPGCEITRRTLAEPRPNVVYIVRLNPKLIEFIATPANGQAPQETTLQTTRAFLEEHKLDLAFNTAFFRLGKDGELPVPFADLAGAAVAEGEVVSQQENGYPALEIDKENRLRLLGPRWGIEGRHIVIAGSHVLVEAGRSRIPNRPGEALHPRTAIGAAEDGTLIVMIVDGRQPGRSEGVTLFELGDLMVAEGAVLAVNLDGGGSTTLVGRDEQGKGRVLNVPVGIADQPGSERPVGASLGVRAVPPAAVPDKARE